MILLAHAAFIIIYGGVAVLYYFNKPEKVNYMYGYRSQLSMKNEHTWKAANEFAASLQVVVAISLFVFQMIVFFLVDGVNSILVVSAFMVINSVLMIPVTELHLRSIFDKNGDFKSKPNSKS